MVQTNIERWWTNREEELAILARMVRGEMPQRVFVIRANAGHGKSWLLDRMKDWCRQQSIPCTLMDFDHIREGGTLSAEVALEKAVESLQGMVAIERETVVRLIVEWRGGTVPVTVGEKSEFKETMWYGDIAGFIVKDLHVYATREGESPVLRRRRATKRFCESLPAFMTQPVVWLVDTCERADPDTRDWLCGEIVGRIAREELPLVLVLAGRPEFTTKLALEEVSFDLKPEWRHAVYQHTLTPFDAFKTQQLIKHVELVKHVGLNLNENALDLLLAATGGVPQDLVYAIERYAQARGIIL